MNNDTITIPLSKTGKHAGKYIAIVDACDRDFAELNWSVLIKDNTQYAMRWESTSEGRRLIYLHREILERMLAPMELTPEMQVDHISGDGLDNRRENLRPATHGQNLRNRGKQNNNTSGYKGVSKSGKKWIALIRVSGKNKYLGSFDNSEDAYKAYCEAADKYHGEFANYGD